MTHHYSDTAILLAGGTGTRIGGPIPKQFMPLGGLPLALHSFKVFLACPQIDEIVVVCPEAYQHLFSTSGNDKSVRFASPGNRRQDSVFNGLEKSISSSPLVCIHDGARPFINAGMVGKVLEEAHNCGAATVAVPLKFTVKEADSSGNVINTPDRSKLWEIQTPQVVSRALLRKGFDYALANGLTVTDDVSLVELIGGKVKLVEGSHTNIKLTVPSDIAFAETLLKHTL